MQPRILDNGQVIITMSWSHVCLSLDDSRCSGFGFRCCGLGIGLGLQDRGLDFQEAVCKFQAMSSFAHRLQHCMLDSVFMHRVWIRDAGMPSRRSSVFLQLRLHEDIHFRFVEHRVAAEMSNGK